MNIDGSDLKRAFLMYRQFLLKLGVVEEESGVAGFELWFDEWDGCGTFSDFVVREAAKRLREDGRV